MKELWQRCALGAALILTATNFLSCMHELKLVSITIHPTSFTFPTPDPDVHGDFTAFGNYIHPPDTRDITDKVTWKTDVPQLLQINGGVVSPQPGNVCGIADVSASMQDGGNLVIAYATVTVNDPTNPLCPGGSQTQGVVIVSLAGSGTGIVTSAPAGITCPGKSCGALFNVGSTVVLTAAPDGGSTFGNWDGCAPPTDTTCSVVVTPGTTVVTATFN